MQTTAGKVKDIIAEQLVVRPEEVIPEASLCRGLGADELDGVEIIIALEDEFDIDIPEEDAERLETVQQVVAYVQSKISAK